jgi:DnaK suppressor protein
MATHHWRANRTQLHGLLDARRRHLAEELQRLKGRIREHGSEAKLATESDDSDDRELDAWLLELTSATLGRIDAAIERLREGHYDRCARCRGRIAEARLLAMPFAVRCQRCESAREREKTPPQTARKSRLWADGPP